MTKPLPYTCLARNMKQFSQHSNPSRNPHLKTTFLLSVWYHLWIALVLDQQVKALQCKLLLLFSTMYQTTTIWRSDILNVSTPCLPSVKFYWSVILYRSFCRVHIAFKCSTQTANKSTNFTQRQKISSTKMFHLAHQGIGKDGSFVCFNFEEELCSNCITLKTCSLSSSQTSPPTKNSNNMEVTPTKIKHRRQY